MLSYCSKCRKSTESINPKLTMVKQLHYQNVLYVVVKNQFVKKQEAKGILTSLGFKIGLEKIPSIGDYLL